VDTNWINQIFAPLRDPKTWESVFGYSTKEPWFFTEFSFLAVFGVFLIFYDALVQKNTWRKIYLKKIPGAKSTSSLSHCSSITNPADLSWVSSP